MSFMKNVSSRRLNKNAFILFSYNQLSYLNIAFLKREFFKLS